MTEPAGPLRLDAPREELLEHAAKLVAEAWQSFDHFRPEEPPLDERVLQLLRTELPERPMAAHEALDDAARILDESIAQPRPRYFVGVGSSGLEIGAIADLEWWTRGGSDYDDRVALTVAVRRAAGETASG